MLGRGSCKLPQAVCFVGYLQVRTPQEKGRLKSATGLGKLVLGFSLIGVLG